ncbi:MAG: hypothetical protein V7603_3793 [Micromonosporaceae bacterium]
MSDRAPVSQLERRYRAVLRVLPAAYRAAWEEDMVATFLASVHTDDPEAADFAADYGRPGWTEVASVLALAVRLRVPGLRARLGGPGAPPSGLLVGGTIRLVVLIAVLANAADALARFVSQLWVAGRVPWLPGLPAELVQAPPGLWQQLSVPAGVGWIAAYVALLLGYWRAAQVVAALAVLPEAARLLANTADLLSGASPYLLTNWFFLLLNPAVVLGMAAFHRDTPVPRRRPWLLAFAAGALLVWGVGYLSVLARDRTGLVDWPGLTSVVLVVAAGIHLASRRTRRDPRRAVALAFLAVVVFVARVMSLLDYALFAAPFQHLPLLALGGAEAVAVLAVGLPLVVLAARQVRLPAPTPAER